MVRNVSWISPKAYDAWYETPRGRWMGQAEVAALLRLGRLAPGMRVLDAGCGSGYFTRRFAAAGCRVVGVDVRADMLAYARTRDPSSYYLQADLRALPFRDKSFDVATAVTALCFVPDEKRALAELLRVARRTVLLGLLHRYSLLYLRKHGRGAYAAAHWHTRVELERLVRQFPAVRDYRIEALLFWPGGARWGRWFERWPWLAAHFGAFLAVRIDL